MIKIKNVTKTYGDEALGNVVNALSDVSLTINDGEFVAIVGRSGCGKTTLMNIIGALDLPDSGEVLFNDVNITSLKEDQRAKFRNLNTGFIFQSFYLDNNFTILENITLPLMVRGIPLKEREELGKKILSKLGILEKANRFPLELSGGEMQRVSIGRALITKPKIILADEPTGNLDSNNGKIVIDMLREISSEGTTVVLVTHNKDDALKCDRLIELFDGKIGG